MGYDFTAIENKWQKYWDEHKTFHAENDYSKPKFYALVEFPYPSGQGLHIGHPRPYTAMDIVSRKRRLQGYNVLFPMGWDAFGLPTENFAIKNKIHPAIVTKNNVARFKAQLKSLGLSFDWDREINTTDPDYFKWTQWIFLKLFKAGLAYKKEMNVNWCTSCKVVLANEEVVNGKCERCGGEVVHKVKSQWMLKITEYAQKLIDDLDSVDYFEKIKTAQKNWIGRSTGAEVDFTTTAGDMLTIYTTRPDTLFGATYMVISPEHPIIEKWADKLQNMDAIREYQAAAARKSDFDRTEMNKDKTGVKLEGVRAVNPVNGKEIPIFISDYVLMTYGTGAIMAVPAHDTRDWEFAKVFNLPIIEVVKGGEDVQKEAFTDCATGIMVNSEFLDGLSVEQGSYGLAGFLCYADYAVVIYLVALMRAVRKVLAGNVHAVVYKGAQYLVVLGRRTQCAYYLCSSHVVHSVLVFRHYAFSVFALFLFIISFVRQEINPRFVNFLLRIVKSINAKLLLHFHIVNVYNTPSPGKI